MYFLCKWFDLQENHILSVSELKTSMLLRKLLFSYLERSSIQVLVSDERAEVSSKALT